MKKIKVSSNNFDTLAEMLNNDPFFDDGANAPILKGSKRRIWSTVDGKYVVSLTKLFWEDGYVCHAHGDGYALNGEEFLEYLLESNCLVFHFNIDLFSLGD